MGNSFPDFSRAATLGFQSGEGQGRKNALGQFIRNVLTNWQQQRQMGQEYEMKKGLIEAETGAKFGLEQFKSQLEQQSPESQARAGYYNQLTEYMKKAGVGEGIPNTEEKALQQIPSNEIPEDYNIKVETRSVKGIPQTIYRPERKQNIPPKQIVEMKDIESTIQGIERNLKIAQTDKELGGFLGPGIVQRPGAIADILGQYTAPKRWNAFKAGIDMEFQKYRKWVTGVQAGYPELQWLVVDYPKPTDRKEIFIQKSMDAIEKMRMNKDIFVDYLQKGGYAAGKLKGTSIEKQSKNLSDEEAYAEYLKMKRGE